MTALRSVPETGDTAMTRKRETLLRLKDKSKDSKQVFYKNRRIEQASPATFRYDYATGLGTDGFTKFKAGKLTTTEYD